MRDLWRPAAVAAVLLTPFLVLGACKSGDPAPEPVPEPDETPAVAGFTHDGAVPIAVINSFEDTRGLLVRKKEEGAAAAACTYLTTGLQDAMVEEAQSKGLVGKKADCGEAMAVLVKRVPSGIESFTVARAEDEETEIVVVRRDGTADAYTLSGDREKNLWLIDDVTPAEVPEVPEVEQPPVGELLPSMKKDRKG